MKNQKVPASSPVVSSRLLPFFVFAISLPFVSLQAAPITWDGDTDTVFSNGANWVDGTAPADSLTTDIGVFGTSLTTHLPSLTANRSITGLEFQRTTGGWTLGGGTNVLTIGASGINDTANTSGTTNINTNVTIGANQTWSSGTGGNLAINGTALINANRILTIGGGTVTVQSLNADATNRTFQKNGAGDLVITGAAGANLGGTINLRGSGGVTLGHQSALGTGTVDLAFLVGAPIVRASTDLVASSAIANNFALRTGSSQFAGSHSMQISGNFTNSGGNHTLNNNITSGKSLILSGNVFLSELAGTGRTLTVAGSGTTEISGAIANFNGSGTAGNVLVNGGRVVMSNSSNSYSGTTTVSAGTLIINGSVANTSSVSVANGASFGREVTSALSIAVNTTFANGSTIVLALDTGLTNASLNRTNGMWAFDTDQAFSFTNLGGATTGTYTGLITGLTGSEAGLASIGSWTITNAGWAGNFSYDGAGSVNLNVTAIPEPSAIVLLAGAAGLLALRRRSRRCKTITALAQKHQAGGR